ncbi:MAG: MgtC/SapB family protein [Clostridia bacterium]|nr:MgtC/SapB family protein [Clostridia bacterium]
MAFSDLFTIEPLSFHLNLIFKLVLSCVLGGIIGYEREHTNRPAGFRTHILVCVGSALVMVTSEYIFRSYHNQTNIDPARLGAQVISGIGFLGAGTIIREGFSVKGLTTAASLWAVSCVGIAAGIGFYEGAVIATVLIYITLIMLKKMEDSFSKNSAYRAIHIQSMDKPGQIAAISSIFDKNGIPVKRIEFINEENEKNLSIKILAKIPSKLGSKNVISDLHSVEGIYKVYEE